MGNSPSGQADDPLLHARFSESEGVTVMTRIRPFWIALLSFLLVAGNGLTLASPQGSNTKPIKIIVRVEGERPERIEMQDARVLSPLDLARLASSIRTELAKLKDHVLVDADDPSDAIGINVIAAKYPTGSDHVFVLSSVITMTDANGTETFVSHDVVATKDFSSGAKALAFYLKSVEFGAPVAGR